MFKRIFSGAVGIALILGIIFFSSAVPILIDIFVALVSAVAVSEFTAATKTIRLLPISVASITFAFVYPMLLNYDMGLIIWYIYTAVMLSMMIFNHKNISFLQFAYVYSMTVIITLSMSTVIMMKDMDIDHSAFYFVLALALPWLADAGAYFAGTFFGKHKLCPEISPKKTIEGAIGGTLFCILSTCVLGYVFSQWIFVGTVSVNYWYLMLLSFFGSLFSILGDLSFSLVKRSFKIKDYGNLIPGHGGVLDRFDSVIFVAPFLYIMVKYLPVLNI